MGGPRRAGAKNIANRWQVQTDNAVLIERHSIQTISLCGDSAQRREQERPCAVCPLLEAVAHHLNLHGDMAATVLAKFQGQCLVKVALHRGNLRRRKMAYQGDALIMFRNFLKCTGKGIEATREHENPRRLPCATLIKFEEGGAFGFSPLLCNKLDLEPITGQEH